jgi:dolichol-phosphate mannosyltransferase
VEWISPDHVVVVVPTYNECENLPTLAAAVLAQGYRLIVVDDDSPDGTGKIADRLAEGEPRMRVVHRPAKEGLGPAYGSGFISALAQNPEVIVQMDCDLSHDPADIQRLVKAISSGAEVAMSSRYIVGGSTPDWPRRRRFLSKGGNLYARAMLGLPIRDATGGFRAWRPTALEKLDFQHSETSGYGFQVELAMRSVDNGLQIEEVPIIFRDRTHGTSKMNAQIVIEAIVLVTLWGLQRRVASIRHRVGASKP